MFAPPLQPASLVWEPPSVARILSWPLPYNHKRGDRCLVKAMALLARRKVLVVSGLEHIRTTGDPFILAASHSTRSEAILLPAVLALHRGGRVVHFLADWNFRLIPGIGFLYRRGGAITVTRKPAKPQFLNILKPLYTPRIPAMEQAHAHLMAGRPVGAFPEGTVNRNPDRLMRGRFGVARLSLETGVPVVPVGIRFPEAKPGQPISDHDRMEIHIGPPLAPETTVPVRAGSPVPIADVRGWHAVVMNEIGRLSGKSWAP
jgi:1-acyl-sn-glycerol-3-phosphate acyltransferase